MSQQGEADIIYGVYILNSICHTWTTALIHLCDNKEIPQVSLLLMTKIQLSIGWDWDKGNGSSPWVFTF